MPNKYPKVKLFILCGIPFSGKSTLANAIATNLGFIKVDLDETKFELFGNSVLDSEIDQNGWNLVYNNMYAQIKSLLISGKTVVHDTGNFTKNERQLVKDLADQLNLDSLTIFVNTDINVALERLRNNRNNKTRFDVSDKDFYSAVEEMETPSDEEKHLVFDSQLDKNINTWIKQNI